METLDLSIVIINFNTKKLVSELVSSIYKKTKKINFEVIIVDNASSDGSLSVLRKLAKKSNLDFIENSNNLGFAAGNNIGIKKAKGRYILLLNSDVLITSNSLGDMVNWMDEHADVGISTCMLKNKDGSIQGTGGFFPNLSRVFSWMIIQDFPFVDNFIKPFHPMKEKSPTKANSFYEKPRELDWVTGAFFLMRNEVIVNVGDLDEKYFMYTEETDFCFRAKKKGWKVWYVPQFSVIHYGGASGTREFSVLSEYKSIKRFYKKHYPSWQFPVLRLLLKIGALGRIILFAIIEGIDSAKIYAKAFKAA